MRRTMPMSESQIESAATTASEMVVPEVIQALVDRAHESLSVELKAWIDPASPEGRAKIAKACIALRNQNGGFLVIGFDNTTRAPLTEDVPSDVRATYHSDVIQRIVSNFSSQSFEVFVHFPKRGGIEHPVIQVPAGVATPAACRADLRVGEKWLLRESDIYVRTLASNGTVSSARASWKDLESLMMRCHDNREADLARVFGRMAQGMTRESFANVLRTITEIAEVATAVVATPNKLLNEGAARFDEVVQQRNVKLPPLGCWDTALIIQGEVPPHRPNKNFLQLLGSANPDLTGWPVWLDSQQFSDQAAHPYIVKERWEAFIFRVRAEVERSWGHRDFWILDPKGHFFLRRAHQDDLGGSGNDTVMRVLDPHLAILRVCEALAVGQAFGRAMGCSEADTKLSFAFRWTKLERRVLEAWSSPWQPSIGSGTSMQDDAQSSVAIPLTANEEALCLATHEAVLPLMAGFGGYEPSYDLTRQLATRLLQRKL